MSDPFLTCLTENVAELKGYGKKRIAEAQKAYTRIRDSRMAMGEDMLTAQYSAMAYVTDEINLNIERRAAALQQNTKIMADATRRLSEVKPAIALRSFNENMQHVVDAPSMSTEEARIGGRNQAILTRESSTLTVRDKWGRRPPKEQQRDLAREMTEGGSGNTEAKNAAKAIRQVLTMAYGHMREYGINVRPYNPTEQLPIGVSPNKLLKRDAELSKTFVRDFDQGLNWSEMQWPDGRRVLPAEREQFLTAYRNAVTSGGKLTSFANEFGDDLEKAFLREVMDQRMLKFKDGATYQALHDKYADGDVFTTLQSLLTHVTREEAKARIYGPNPDRMVATISALAQRKILAGEIGPKTLSGINAVIRRFNNEAVYALRSNPADPNNPWALGAGGMANMVSAAQLGSAIIANTMGDAANIITLNMAENRGVQQLISTVIEYVKAQIPGNAYPTLMNLQRSGYLVDDMVFNDVQSTRLNVVSTTAPTLTKGWARFWNTAGGVPRHTNALRAAVNKGFLADMAHWRGSKLVDLPEATQNMMRNAGIGPGEWDEIRANMVVAEPRPGAEIYDTIASYDTLSRDLAERMHRMQINEVNGQVLLPTNEASVIMRGVTRPDTIQGAVIASFAMYTAQPLAASMHVVRTIMNGRMSTGRRVASMATYGLTMLATGALSLQLRGLIAGRKPEDMTTPEFWGKALVAGGVLSVWGGYAAGVFEGDINNVYRQIAGPIVGAIGETTIAVGQTAYQMAGLSDDTDGLRHLAEAFERYIGPKPFYVAAVLNREIYERLKELADPVGYRRSVSTRINNAKKRGQTYQPGWKPSDRPVTKLLTGR